MEKGVKKSDLLKYIADKLREKTVFQDYTIHKNNKTLVLKDILGSYRIELNTNLSFDIERNESSNELTPYFYRKFDILHNWFKKHTVLSSSDFRDRASILLDGNDLNIKEEYHFLVTNNFFKEDYQQFISDLKKGAFLFQTKFQNLEQLFEYQVLPIIRNKDFVFNTHSFDDYFFILKLVYLIFPNDFDELKNRIFEHIKIQSENEHPHALFYLPKFEEIISDLKKEKASRYQRV